MKRWFISRMLDDIGDGSRGPKIALYTDTWRQWSQDGAQWCIGQCALRSLAQTRLNGTDNTPLRKDPDIKLFPDVLLSLQWQAFGTSARTEIMDFAAAAGFNTQGVIGSMRIKDCLNYLVQQMEPTIDVENGDVQDLP